MKRIIRLTESDLTRIVRRVIKESDESSPLGIKLITPQGIGTDIELVKDSYGFNAVGLNICEFFQVRKQGGGKDVYKTKIQLTNKSNKGIYIVDADINSIDLDIYPQVTNKLIGPGQQISFNVEITPASLDDESVSFNISYKFAGETVTGSGLKKEILTFDIKNNISECASEATNESYRRRYRRY
jgi:hypothetical protein